MLCCQGAQNIGLSNDKLKSALICTMWSQCTPVPDRQMDERHGNSATIRSKNASCTNNKCIRDAESMTFTTQQLLISLNQVTAKNDGLQMPTSKLTAFGSSAAYLITKRTNHRPGVTANGKAEECVRPESKNHRTCCNAVTHTDKHVQEYLGLMTHSTHNRSFWGRPSEQVTWLVINLA